MATDIEVIVDPAAISTAVTVDPASVVASVTLSTGAPGPQGDKGDQGERGLQGEVGPTPWTFVGAYNNGLDYGIGDAVTYQGGFYYRTGNPNNPGYPPQPGSINASWTPIADAGATGPQGPAGANGTDASVTSQNVVSALGFSPIGDAPSNGSQYARKDGAWEVVEVGGGSGVSGEIRVFYENANISTVYSTAQAAFQAAYASAGESLISLPPGTFSISPLVDWPSRIKVSGAGVDKTSLTVTGTTAGLHIIDAVGYSMTITATGGNGSSGYHAPPQDGGSVTCERCVGSFYGGDGGYADGDGIEISFNGGNGGDVTLIDCIAVDVQAGTGGGTISDPNGSQAGADGYVVNDTSGENGAAQVNADWNATSGVAEILNKPTIQSFDQSLNTSDSPIFSVVKGSNGVGCGPTTAALGGQHASELCATGTATPLMVAGGSGLIEFWDDAENPSYYAAFGLAVPGASASGDFVTSSYTNGSWAETFRVGTNGQLSMAGATSLSSAGGLSVNSATVTATANTSALTASYSVTGANTTPLLNLSGTWNTSGVARGILLNITDTASNANSLLLALQTGGTTRFSVNKFGGIFGNEILLGTWFQARSNGVFMGSQPIMWGPGAATGSVDTYLLRDGAANTLAQRNGTNAQTKRIYNTYTDASNYERGFMRWNSNVLEIGTEAAGTGTQRTLAIIGNTNFNNSVSFSQFITNLGSGVAYKSQAADPTTANLVSGYWQVYRNTTTGVVKLWANNNGTMVSVALS